MEWIRHETWVLADTGFQISKHPQASKYMILDRENACLGEKASRRTPPDRYGPSRWPRRKMRRAAGECPSAASPFLVRSPSYRGRGLRRGVKLR
jgi:hypothetical protein